MTSQTIDTDLAVLGGGPGGYAAAFRAADLGLDVTLIDERPDPGGVCLHVGCIPSKALLHAARLINESREAKAWGLDFGEPKVDLARLRAWKDEVVGTLVGGAGKLAKARKVRMVRGFGVFMDSSRITVEDSDVGIVRFRHAIVATGSSPFIPPPLRIKNPRLMDSTGALALEDIPARLLVIGGGYIGLEMATVYAALGSEVTVVEMTAGLLPGADRDLVRPLAARLKTQVKEILLKTKVTGVAESGDTLRVTMETEGGEGPATKEFDRVLVAVGRRPNTGGFGLENTGVQIDEHGFIQVDHLRRTHDRNIFAIGDAAGQPMLAHKAHREGVVAAEVLAGKPSAYDPAAIPAVVFTDPEIAWTGMTQDEAKAQGIEVNVGRFPWGASGRAVTLDRTEGMTKIVCDAATDRVLGVGIVGAGAGELIAEATLAIEMGAVAEDLAATIHPHPTLTETLMEGAELALGSAIHLYRPPKK